MWDQDIRLLSRHAALRLQSSRDEQLVWKRQLDELHDTIASSQLWLGIATAAIETAFFGLLAQQAAVLIAAKLFRARAGAVAARAVVAGYTARRTAAGGTVIMSSVERVGSISRLIAALAASVTQVGVKEIYSDQKLGDVLLTLGVSALPPALFRNIGGLTILRNGRRTVVRNTFVPLLLSRLGAQVDISTLDLVDLLKTFAEPAMSAPTRGGDRAAVNLEGMSPDQVRELLLDRAGDIASVTAQLCFEFATAQARTVGLKAGQEAAAQDYTKITGNFAAFYSDIEDQLEDVSITYANCTARVELWQAVLRAFVRLEYAMAQLRRDLEVRRLNGPQFVNGRIMDYQMRLF